MNRALTYHDILRPLLAAAGPATARLDVTFDDVTVEIASNSQALIDKLAAYFHDFLGRGGTTVVPLTAVETAPPVLAVPYSVKDREPGKSPKEEYVDLPDGRIIRKLRTGMVFFFGEDENYAVGPCLANDNQVVNFINNRFIELRLKRGALLFHAAGIAEQGTGLVISGFAGAGKSTLALEIMRHGTDFVSNDRVMVSRDKAGLVMTGVAKMPRVNPGTVLHNPNLAPVMSQEDRRTFAALPEAELWDLEHKYDAFIDQCFGPGRFKLACRMGGLVVLNWKREAAPMVTRRVDLGRRRDLMPAFMKDVGLFYELDDPAEDTLAGPDDYLALLGDLPVLEVAGGVHFHEAALACLEFLRQVRA